MTTKEEIKRMTDNLSDEQAEKIYRIIYTMIIKNIEEVEPDEWDLKMLREFEEDPDKDKPYVSFEDLCKELDIKL